MQTWTKPIGTVSVIGGTVLVVAVPGDAWIWANRVGQSWPCSTLTNYHRVAATIDYRNGDLLDLSVYDEGRFERLPGEGLDIDGSELTAWIDDCLAGTPFAHLAKHGAGEAV